jgi:hypothetical protein
MANPIPAASNQARIVIDPVNFEQNLRRWAELVDADWAELLAKLRCQIGPDGDLRAAIRAWQAERAAEKDQFWRQYAENYARSLRHASQTSPQSQADDCVFVMVHNTSK